jgi:hypothetical protein
MISTNYLLDWQFTSEIIRIGYRGFSIPREEDRSETSPQSKTNKILTSHAKPELTLVTLSTIVHAAQRVVLSKVYTSRFIFRNRPQDMENSFPFTQPYLSHVPASYHGCDHQRIPAVDCFALFGIPAC